MKRPPVTSAPVYVEIGQTSIKVLDDTRGLELPLEREGNGRITDACRTRLVADLKNFLNRQNPRWESRLQAVPIPDRLKAGLHAQLTRAFCAISARGVSLRHLTIPATTKENFEQVLLLQIESEFPLPPDELAWGCRQPHPPRGAAATQELTVAAIKKEVIEDYAGMLLECGLDPVFTLGALAASSLFPPGPGSCALLDIGRTHSELTWFCNGAPTATRILAWGGDEITRAIQETLEITREEAGTLKINDGPTVERAVDAALESLAPLIKTTGAPQKLYLTGKSARPAGLAPRLGKTLGGWECEALDVPAGEGRSAAILGLRRSHERTGDLPPLVLQWRRPNGAGEAAGRTGPWKWAAIAAALFLGLISMRYAEAVLKKPGLAAKLAEIQAARENLPGIERETRFIQFLDQSQPRYVEAIWLLANASASGTRFDSVTINRRGEMSLRGSMRNSQQATEFRSKLLETGKFSSVVIEEQTPTPDRQKIIVRIGARWKPAG